MQNPAKNSLGIAAAFFLCSLAGPLTAFAAGPATVNLGTAGNYVILSKTLITTTGATARFSYSTEMPTQRQFSLLTTVWHT